MNYIRGVIFNFLYALCILMLSIPGFIIVPLLPLQKRLALLKVLPRSIHGLLVLTCGITFKIEGKENIPDGPFVLVANHQSTWETFILSYLFSPIVAVMKKELTYIPVFGWVLLLSQPIVIDRNRRQSALKDILRQGQALLEQGISVVIFPEGTRVPVGEERSHFPGGAMLACKAGVPLLPLVHNAGAHWPAHKVAKIPGQITIKIGAPISTAGRSAKELSLQVETWINTEKRALETR